MDSDKSTSDDYSSLIPLILLASDNPHVASYVRRTLEQEGLSVRLAPGYEELEPLSQSHLSAIALIEVSHQQSVEAAVNLALRLKRRNARRFVGYLADPILYTSGLAGDGIFPRSTHHLTAALRAHFRNEK
jgi:CheY-like chemotaxis protein